MRGNIFLRNDWPSVVVRHSLAGPCFREYFVSLSFHGGAYPTHVLSKGGL